MKTSPRHQMVFGFLCTLLLLCAAPRFAPAEEDAPAAVPAPLNKGDALLIRIEGLGGGLPEYREVVDSDGNIELPFLGFLSADGKLPAALAAEMSAAYSNAKLSATSSVQITFVTHFDPPPSRTNLVRSQDPRRPIPAPGGPIQP